MAKISEMPTITNEINASTFLPINRHLDVKAKV
jgi:hypothetical protein